MTTVKPILHSAVDALPSTGGTAIWDGIHAGIIELINNGANPCRTVIAMTDGGDNASTHSAVAVDDPSRRSLFHRLFRAEWGFAGCVFLPPRSPAFNPAELAFAYMKQFGAGKVNEEPGKPQGYEESGSVSEVPTMSALLPWIT